MMVGRDIEDLYSKRSIPAGETALDVVNLSTTDGAVNNVSFSVRRGEVVGVAGSSAAGRPS